MKVVETVENMIRNWPTLYETRADALFRLFSYYGAHWVNGELVDEDDVDGSARDYSKDSHWDLTKAEKEGIHSYLWQSRENALIDWRIKNAHLLAKDTSCRMSREDVDPYMHTNHFADMPEDVTQEWFEVAKELAFEIRRLCKDATGHGKNTLNNANRFLASRGLLDNKARQQRIRELKAELAALEGKDDESDTI